MAKMTAARRRMQNEIENATVTVLKKGGHGVLVGGNLIITAAHCVDFSCTGGMVLGDHYVEHVRTARGQNLKVAPLAVEPLSDVAVLGALDDQEFGQEVEEYQTWCEATRPVPLCVADFAFGESFPVRVLDRSGKWLGGRATQFRCEQGLAVETETQIGAGASGGPIINENGELVGVVSHSSSPVRCGEGTKSYGTTARPHLALPLWVYRRVLGRNP